MLLLRLSQKRLLFKRFLAIQDFNYECYLSSNLKANAFMMLEIHEKYNEYDSTNVNNQKLL